MMDVIEFDIPVIPMPAPRPRVTKTGIVYEAKPYKEYKAKVRAVAEKAMNGLNPITSCAWMQLDFIRKMDATSLTYGDIDNLAKGVLDALNGVVFKDDSIIVGLLINKDSIGYLKKQCGIHVKISKFPFEIRF